jgi:hypothetical protein
MMSEKLLDDGRKGVLLFERVMGRSVVPTRVCCILASLIEDKMKRNLPSLGSYDVSQR